MDMTARAPQVVMADTLAVVPPDSPLMIWADPIRLQWTADEADFIRSELGPHATRWLQTLPAGCAVPSLLASFLAALPVCLWSVRIYRWLHCRGWDFETGCVLCGCNRTATVLCVRSLLVCFFIVCPLLFACQTAPHA